MAQGVKIEIVSPEYLVLSATVDSVTVPGADGYLTVMGDHSPLMSVLKPGFVTVNKASQPAERFFVAGGFADISANGLTILAEEAKPASEFGRPEIDARIAQAQKTLEAAQTIEEKMAAQEALDTWKNLVLELAHNSGASH